jgi:two-component system, sensor histidine kinase YesM
MYDLEGNGVYTSKGANYGISFLDKEKAEWYKKISAYKTGTPLLIAAQEFRGSGMNMRDGGSLCIGRGILDLNTIKIVGYCVAGIDTSYLENYFEQNRQAPNQRFAVYKDGKDPDVKYHSHRYDLRWDHISDLSDGRPDLKGIKPSDRSL